ncbi:MAG: type 4a pilus biogenesis protein PilO [Candidatus Nealsonbacteria bacterium]|nr:type 4a pilus biogenesis protein PilO [Candidatus Nealsonbacteria bacterium]
MFSFKNLAIVFLLATLVVSALLVWPEYQKMKPLALKTEIVNSEIKAQEEYLSDLKEIKDKIEKEYKDKIALIDYAFPRDPNLPLLYDFIIKTCSQNGLILTGISNNVSEPSENQKQGIITINLQAAGSYLAQKSFISALENSARMFNVESVNFSSPPEADKPFDFSLSVKTQFVK